MYLRKLVIERAAGCFRSRFQIVPARLVGLDNLGLVNFHEKYPLERVCNELIDCALISLQACVVMRCGIALSGVRSGGEPVPQSAHVDDVGQLDFRFGLIRYELGRPRRLVCIEWTDAEVDTQEFLRRVTIPA
jgi:hypothetical protein